MNKQILLVLDESPELRSHVARMLQRSLASIVVIETGSVEDAINLAEQDNVDLIVSGFGKAIRFGEDLAKRLDERGTAAPLLFYSTHESVRFDMGGKNWSVVQVLNPEFDDLVAVVSGVFGQIDKGGPAVPGESK